MLRSGSFGPNPHPRPGELDEFAAASRKVRGTQGGPYSLNAQTTAGNSPGVSIKQIAQRIPRAVADTGFWAIITGSTAADAPAQNRWLYAWSEVYKSASGYDGWTILESGRSGSTSSDPAYNFVEDMNTGADAHTEGNGIDPANLDPDGDDTDEFAVMPATAGVIVWMYVVSAQDGYEFWFSYENGVDGAC